MMKDTIIILGFPLALILVLGKFLERKRTIQGNFTILLLLDLGIYHILSYILYCQSPVQYPFVKDWYYLFEAIGFTLFLFHGPLHYGYCHSVVSPGNPMPKRYWLHFAPGLLFLFAFLLFVQSVTNLTGHSESPSRFYPYRDQIYLLSIFLAVISYDSYMIVCIRKILPSLRKYPHRNTVLKVMTGTYLAGLVFVSFWLIDTLLHLHFTENVRVSTSLYFIIIYFISCRYPERMIAHDYEEEKKQYLKTQLQGVDVQSVIARLDQIMKDDKLYKEDINLTMLAAKLDLRQHQLSEILNSCLKTTFAKYINDLRIKEASLLLESRPDLQIIEISLETGFNSLSVFYREFRKRTGISPAEYRRAKTMK